MAIQYKMDVVGALKQAGYSTYRIRQDKLMGEATLQNLREGKLVSWENIATLCRLLNIQPGDLLEYVPEVAAPHEDLDATVNVSMNKSGRVKVMDGLTKQLL